jgi:type IV pilus assembly protein PilM
LLSRRTAATGIDLGHHTVKLVRLEQNGNGPVLTHWGLRPVLGNGGENVEGRGLALKELMRELGLRARRLGRVTASVSGRDVHLRQVSLPALSPEELRAALPFEAKKHLPLESLQDPCLDFQILGRSQVPGDEDKPGEGQDVLLVAAPRARRDRVLRILDTVGIDPGSVDADPLPAVNAVLEAHPQDPERDEAVVVLDLGATNSVLAAVHPRRGLYVRSLECTCNVLTDRIEERLSFDRTTAEQMLTELKGEEGRQIQSVLEESMTGLVREIEETVRFLSLRQRIETVSRIYLCGGGSLIAGLGERIASALTIAVEHADPLGDLKVAKGDPPSVEERVRLVTATGLARW